LEASQAVQSTSPCLSNAELGLKYYENYNDPQSVYQVYYFICMYNAMG